MEKFPYVLLLLLLSEPFFIQHATMTFAGNLIFVRKQKQKNVKRIQNK